MCKPNKSGCKLHPDLFLLSKETTGYMPVEEPRKKALASNVERSDVLITRMPNK